MVDTAYCYKSDTKPQSPGDASQVGYTVFELEPKIESQL